MLHKVSAGQKLNVKLMNDIIKEARGQMSPSDGQYVQTNNGTLFIQPEDVSNKSPTATTISKFLECKTSKAFELNSFPFDYKKDGTKNILKNTILINLGSSLTEAKNNIIVDNKPVDEIIFFTNEFQYKLESDIFAPSNHPESELKTNTGWIQTGLYDSSFDLFGKLYKAYKVIDNDEEEVKGYYFVITNNKQNDYSEDIKSLVNISDDIKLVETINILTTTQPDEKGHSKYIQNAIGV